MKDENKTKAELIKELKTSRKEQEKGVFKDIAEHIQVEKGLKDSEECLRILFDYAPDAYYISDLKGNFIDGNKEAEKLIGYKKEELIGKNFLKLKLLSLADIPKAAKLLAKNFRRLPTGPDEFVLNRKDNSKVTVEISTYPVKIKGRALALGIARDITERKQAEESLQESEAKYHAVLEQSADNIFLADLETKKILESNVSLRNLLGYSADEMKKLSIYDFVARPKDEIKKKLEQLQKEDKTVIRERKYLRKDGSLVDVEMVRNLITFGNKKVLCVVARDISERKKAEETLKQSEKNYRDLFNNATDAIYIQDRECRFLDINRGAMEMYGYPKEFFIGKTPEFLSAPEKNDLKKIAGFIEDAFNGKPRQYDFWGIRKNGEIFPKIVRSQKGIYMGKEVVVTFAIDITERKQAEERLKKTMDATIDTISKMIEAKDPYTAGHQQRVSQLATAIAKELNLSPDKIEGIRITSLIHDIGKIGVPTEILSKPTKLTDIEFNLIKGHPQIGYDILKSIDFPFPIARIVLQHHEKINGTGYPRGLKGDEILLKAKIICVADVVEAMSSHRPYRPALGIDAALEEISQNRGIFYDPEVVDVCLKLFKEKGFEFR